MGYEKLVQTKLQTWVSVLKAFTAVSQFTCSSVVSSMNHMGPEMISPVFVHTFVKMFTECLI